LQERYSLNPVPPDRTEIEELSAFFQGWRVELIQLGPPSGETLISSVSHPAHRALWLRAGSALVMRGNVHGSNCCAWLSSEPQAPVRFLGQPMGKSDLILAGSSARIDLLVPAGAAFSCLVTRFNQRPARRSLWVCDEDTPLTRYLKRPNSRAGELDSALHDELERASGSGRLLQLERLARTQAVAAVVTACKIVDQRFPVSITLRELAHRCRVSQRTLEYGFRQVYDTTPMRFIRSQRLSRNRAALLRSAARTSIGVTARKFGFTHMGQYSRDYRRLFGETPSLTLARGQR
jgi:AraC-like DNA-binding protein